MTHRPGAGEWQLMARVRGVVVNSCGGDPCPGLMPISWVELLCAVGLWHTGMWAHMKMGFLQEYSDLKWDFKNTVKKT